MKLWSLFGLLLLVGCAATPPARQSTVAQAISSQEGMGWWYAAFKFDWPEGESPTWRRDVMVAHRIVSPVLAAHRQDIGWWRVHRRAARDKAGHRFSFIFYAAPETAHSIYAAIEADPDLAVWSQQGLIREVRFDDPAKITRPGVEDTSDPAWPELIQKTWPSYIQGVSEMWLDLVNRLAAEHAPDTLAEAPYRKVQAELDRLWADNARHAFMHHLNAIYAYQPFWARY
ncbi:MAG: hypothetical protein ACPW60_01420 [Methylohalobius sp. ZOD2]|nr:hypothetical protein [Methylothermaceae bacterium]